MRAGISITVTPEDRVQSESVVGDRNTPQKHVWRARIILLTADGIGTNGIVRAVGKDKTAIWRWQERFMQAGDTAVAHPTAAGRDDRPRDRAHQRRPAARGDALDRGGDGEGRGHQPLLVQRIWKAHGLAPHRVRSFKLSNDPKFAEKLKDVVGLYIDPPAHAVVLSVDEKPQIQALDRTQPGLPMKKGRAGTMTHDYKRHGTTTLFAALDVLEGKVLGRCMQRHRHQEFVRDRA